MLSAQIIQLILGLDVVNADLALLLQLVHKKVFQRDVLYTRNVGAVAGDMQRRRVVNVQRHAAEALVEVQLQHHSGAEHSLFQCQSCRTSVSSIVYCSVSPCSPTLKLIGALTSITMYEVVDLPLLGLLPQSTSEKAASLKPPCL